MTAKLVAEEGITKGLVLSFENGTDWTIGRDPEVCQLVIEDPSVSRKHLMCHLTSKGIVIQNLSSTNPISVNGKEVSDSQLLNNGDAIKIGNGAFRFYNNEAAVINGIPGGSVTSEENTKNETESHHDSIFDENAPAGKNALAEINFEPLDVGRWLLKVIGGPNNGAEFSMQASNTYVIGTDPNSCDIVFHDTSVSRQHAKIQISQDDNLEIEDLKSRNGTLVDGEPLKGSRKLLPNVVISLGTTSFIIYDREGEMQTIISPLLPSIVKVLQKEEAKPQGEAGSQATTSSLTTSATPVHPKEKTTTFSAFILVAIITGLFVLGGIGTATLFKSEPVKSQESQDVTKVLANVMKNFPSVKYSFNNGRLLLIGHVLTSTDKTQLYYNLEGLNFIKSVDDKSVIIDQYVLEEANQLLSNNPNWKGITIQSPSPGHFVVSGYLQTRRQAEQLSEYLKENFRYLDLLEKQTVVDEDVINTATTELQNLGIRNLAVQMSNGELTLTGVLPKDKAPEMTQLLNQFKAIPGVRIIKNFVTMALPEASLVNISDKYAITGYSSAGNNISVVINGKILTKGDSLDGMIITTIGQNRVLLEKDGVKYVIDYSK